jgi:hypothetical protein
VRPPQRSASAPLAVRTWPEGPRCRTACVRVVLLGRGAAGESVLGGSPSMSRRSLTSRCSSTLRKPALTRSGLNGPCAQPDPCVSEPVFELCCGPSAFGDHQGPELRAVHAPDDVRDVVVGLLWTQLSRCAQVRREQSHVAGPAFADLVPEFGARLVGDRCFAQGDDDRGQAGLHLGDGGGVAAELLRRAPCFADLLDVVALLGGHGVIRPGDCGLEHRPHDHRFGADGCVHGVEGHLGPFGDVGDSGRGIPLLREQIPGRCEDQTPCGGRLRSSPRRSVDPGRLAHR